MVVKEQLNILVNLASSDNMVAEKELRLIKMLGVANKLSADEIEEIIQNPQPIGDLSGLTDDQKFEYLYHVVQLMKADGQVFKSEIAFCEDVAAKLGYKKGVIAELSSRIFSDPGITADRDHVKAKAQKFLS